MFRFSVMIYIRWKCRQ